METQEVIMDTHSKAPDDAKAHRSGWLSSLFGCWHRELSRPFTSQGQTYRTCVYCGARRKFNINRWEMQGDFYYGLPTTKHFHALSGMPAR
jgi:hypothetical protein